jgi:hypothetical protein
MLLLPLVFIREYLLQPVSLVLGHDQVFERRIMADEELLAATFATNCAHRNKFCRTLHRHLTLLDRDRVCHPKHEYNDRGVRDSRRLVSLAVSNECQSL